MGFLTRRANHIKQILNPAPSRSWAPDPETVLMLHSGRQEVAEQTVRIASISAVAPFQKPNGNQSILENAIHWGLSVPKTVFGW
jgi:hypothetical protein